MPLSEERRASLLRLFRNRAYRRDYVEGFYNTRLATQIKFLREESSSTQTQLGKTLATQQSAISKLENANYSSWNVKTLRRLARAFDVALQVRFVTFGEALADIEQFSTAALSKVPFKDDPVFQVAPQSLTLRSTTAAGASTPTSTSSVDIMAALRESLAGMHVRPVSRDASAEMPIANDNLALAS